MSSSPTTGRAEADGVDRPTLRCQQSSINGERNGKQDAQRHRSQRRTREVDHVPWPDPAVDDGGSKGERRSIGGTAILEIVCDDGPPKSFALRAGMMAVIPQGGWHRFHSSEGVTLMTATPFPGEKIDLDVDDPRT